MHNDMESNNLLSKTIVESPLKDYHNDLVYISELERQKYKFEPSISKVKESAIKGSSSEDGVKGDSLFEIYSDMFNNHKELYNIPNRINSDRFLRNGGNNPTEQYIKRSIEQFKRKRRDGSHISHCISQCSSFSVFLERMACDSLCQSPESQKRWFET